MFSIFPQLMALNLKSDWWCKFIHYMVERKRTQDDGQLEGCTAALYEAAVPVSVEFSYIHFLCLPIELVPLALL